MHRIPLETVTEFSFAHGGLLASFLGKKGSAIPGAIHPYEVKKGKAALKQLKLENNFEAIAVNYLKKIILEGRAKVILVTSGSVASTALKSGNRSLRPPAARAASNGACAPGAALHNDGNISERHFYATWWSGSR